MILILGILSRATSSMYNCIFFLTKMKKKMYYKWLSLEMSTSGRQTTNLIAILIIKSIYFVIW